MHGLGNDFVILDQRRMIFDLSPDQLCRISHRRLGLGCDQVVLLRLPEEPACDASVLMYNADGSRVDMCGNAVRCIGDFLAKETRKTTLSLETSTRLITVCIRNDGASRCPVVDMGPPQFFPDSVAFLRERVETLFPQMPLKGDPSVVSLGNLHTVFFVSDLHTLPIEEIGPKFGQNAAFPQECNVEFVQIDSPHIFRCAYGNAGPVLHWPVARGLVPPLRRPIAMDTLTHEQLLKWMAAR